MAGTRRVGGAIKKPKREDSPDSEKEVEKKPARGRGKATIEPTEKEAVKQVPKKDNGKLQSAQEKILLEIENQNAKKHIQELCDKFTPPSCKKCSNRNADRICVSEECGAGEYGFLSLICGKCHLEEHSKLKEKPELDVEEFFIKLGTFLNTTKGELSTSEQGIDVERLQGSFAQIESCLAQIDQVEEMIQREIESYRSPEEIETHVVSSITKALSDPTFENLTEQLSEIKSHVYFEDNNFKWNGVNEKAKELRNQVNLIKEENKTLQKLITSSFIGGRSLDLEEISLEIGIRQNYNKAPKIINKNGTISLSTQAKTYYSQFYLDYVLDPKKKYTMKFSLTQMSPYQFFIGAMPKSQIQNTYLYGGGSGLSFKRFNQNYPNQDISKVIRGSYFGMGIKTGDEFEMRISIEDQIHEFSTLPEYEDVNSMLDSFTFTPNTEYVITICVQNNVGIRIDSLQESFFFSEY